MNLKGKTAIVTGGAVRIGKAIALALADAGVQIALHYGQSADEAETTLGEISSRGSSGILIQADFNQPVEAARSVVDKTVSEFGRADILINSAAIFEESDLVSVSEEHWDRHFSINLKTPFFLAQAFARQLQADQEAHIINIADWRGTRPGKDHLVYTLTKSALIAMTKSLAQELAPNVRVNAIAPGAILPPPGEEQSYLQQRTKNIPLNRIGSPEAITDALLYLLRSDFITGEVLHITGGEQL